MRARSILSAAFVSLMLPTSALAQGTDAPETEASTSAITPTPTPTPTPRCVAGDQEGIDEADAHTATNLVCSEIAKAGPPADARYRVSLGRLGTTIVLSVARVNESGAVVDTRELRLSGIEEVVVGGPRVAESIVHGTPLPETQTIDNVVASEAREPKRKTGIAHFALGLVGMMPPFDQGFGMAPGIDLDVHYETGQWELGGAFRGGAGSYSNTSPSVGFVMFSLGGRYFTSDRDFSPYIGSGLSWSYLNLKLPATGFSGGNSGMSAYVDAGVEVMRTSHAHLAIGLRWDLPFYQLNNSDGASNPGGGYGQPASSPGPTYYAPLSLETRLTF